MKSVYRKLQCNHLVTNLNQVPYYKEMFHRQVVAVGTD